MPKPPRKIPDIWSENSQDNAPFELFVEDTLPDITPPQPVDIETPSPDVDPEPDKVPPTPTVFISHAGDRTLIASGAMTLDINRNGSDDLIFQYRWQEHPDTKQSELVLSVTPMNGCHFTHRANLLPEGSRLELKEDKLSAQGHVVLKRQVEGANLSRWEGEWTFTNRAYLTVALPGENGWHLGWVNLSIQAETGYLLIHQYAHSTKAGAAITTGEGQPIP